MQRTQGGLVDNLLPRITSVSSLAKKMRDMPVRVHSAVEEEYDVFKHGLLRYFGYANELGESFRPLIAHRWVLASYGVAGLYVAADTVQIH